MTRKSSGSERLRHAIDRGAAGDKVSFVDPAAAPLGTDAEAGGVATDDRAVEREVAATGSETPAPGQNPVDPVRTPEGLVRAARMPRGLAIFGLAVLVLIVVLIYVGLN